MIKVIIGPRRCGKSVLLGQIADELAAAGVAEDRLIRINFESGQSRDYILEPDSFYDHIASLMGTDGKRYLFCDEIQMMEGFETVINAVRVDFDVSIFITGSNSKMLSGELATHLGGRTLQFRLTPFSFGEYLALHDASPSTELLQEYIQWGGFPMVCKGDDDEDKLFVLQNLKDSIFLRDILLRNRIAASEILERILSFVVGNSSLTVSVNTIRKELQKTGVTISRDTIYRYLDLYDQAMIVDRVKRYDLRGKQVLSTQEKFYACDLSLVRLYKNRVKDEMNVMTETLVYLELVSRGYRIYVGKTYKGEIDFIIENEGGKAYVQAAYLMPTAEVRDREFGAFSTIKDAYPKYVISFDPICSDHEGVRHIGMLEFLTGYPLT